MNQRGIFDKDGLNGDNQVFLEFMGYKPFIDSPLIRIDSMMG
jgi:hypothetical protein